MIYESHKIYDQYTKIYYRYGRLQLKITVLKNDSNKPKSTKQKINKTKKNQNLKFKNIYLGTNLTKYRQTFYIKNKNI